MGLLRVLQSVLADGGTSKVHFLMIRMYRAMPMADNILSRSASGADSATDY
jgi:hypothetical protein